MRTSVIAIRVGASCAVVLALAACAKSPVAPQYDKAADEAEIRAIIDGIARDFSFSDTSGMSRYYADDAVFLGLDSPEQNGLSQWREDVARIALDIPPDQQASFLMQSDEIEIAGDLAYERGTYTIQQPDSSGTLRPWTFRHIHIFKRQADGHWKAWRMMENAASPERPGPTAAGR